MGNGARLAGGRGGLDGRQGRMLAWAGDSCYILAWRLPPGAVFSTVRRSRALPVYEYRCTRGHAYEKVEAFSAPTAQECPRCGESARRLLSAPTVIFKGSGFYSTDNRKGGAGGGNGGSAAEGASGDDGPSPAGETKTEAAAAEE